MDFTADGKGLIGLVVDQIRASNALALESTSWFHGKAPKEKLFPSVIVRVGRVSSLAKVKGKLDQRDKNADVIHLSYCTTADRRIIHTVVGMEEFAPQGNTNSRNGIARSMFDRHIGFHYIPWAKLLIILPVDRKQVILQRFDLMESLNSTGGRQKEYTRMTKPRVEITETQRSEPHVVSQVPSRMINSGMNGSKGQ